MAVHGTRHRESVSWNYAGLLQFLGSVARERTGLPLLRCYWYEATVEGRRSSEHEILADLPGVKLRLGRMKPGRREGVESEIHRDLTTLARNRAISDALVVSAEDDLAQVIADVPPRAGERGVPAGRPAREQPPAGRCERPGGDRQPQPDRPARAAAGDRATAGCGGPAGADGPGVRADRRADAAQPDASAARH